MKSSFYLILKIYYGAKKLKHFNTKEMARYFGTKNLSNIKRYLDIFVEMKILKFYKKSGRTYYDFIQQN